MKKLLLSVGLLLSITINAQIPSYVPTNGLVAYYPFSGNANDVGIKKYNGTVHGATLTTDRAGNKDSAYNFDGVSNYIITDVKTLPQSNALRTVSGWFKTSKNETLARIFSYGNANKDYKEFSLAIYYGKGYLKSNFTISNYVTSQENYLDDNWHFFAITYNTAIVALYVDGVFITTTHVDLDTEWGSLLTIGGVSGGSGYYFTGAIDDIGIWNRELTQNEIKALYNNYNLGVSSSNYFNTVTIYPNPTKDHITIDCGNISDIKGGAIKIYNELGQQVFSDLMNTETYNVSLGSWAGKGVYFIKIYDADSIELNTKKVILQ